MTLINIVCTKLFSRLDAYSDLVNAVDEELLQMKIDVNKHKSLAEHFWCVVGARESYARAITSGEWQGFACSMRQFALSDFRHKLDSSGNEVRTAVKNVELKAPASSNSANVNPRCLLA